MVHEAMIQMADGVIIYRQNNEIKEWRVCCHPETDSEQSLRVHLRRWKPDAEFVSARIEKPE